MRVGTSGTQAAFFVAGARGVTTGNSDAIPVVIDSNGQLGTLTSSQRFKEDIETCSEASSGLLRLRPVTFRYPQPFTDGSKPIEYGLIAEEVAEVYPDLSKPGCLPSDNPALCKLLRGWPILLPLHRPPLSVTLDFQDGAVGHARPKLET
jgi:hypothetical protein